MTDLANTIDVALVTWSNHPKRLEYFLRVLESLQRYLTASRHTLRFFCSAESERDVASSWYGDDLLRACGEAEIVLAWRNEPANLGANMNAALAMCSAPVILLQQDDWELLEPLDLSDGADLLLTIHQVDLLRYSWPNDPVMAPTFAPFRDGWQQIDPNGLWPYGDDPHLRRHDFMFRHGWYYEDGSHGTASAAMMQWLVSRQAVILASPRPLYKHIGDVTAVIGDKRGRRITR